MSIKTTCKYCGQLVRISNAPNGFCLKRIMDEKGKWIFYLDCEKYKERLYGRKNA